MLYQVELSRGMEPTECLCIIRWAYLIGTDECNNSCLNAREAVIWELLIQEAGCLHGSNLLPMAHGFMVLSTHQKGKEAEMFCQQMMVAIVADAKTYRLVVLFHWTSLCMDHLWEGAGTWMNLPPTVAHFGNALTDRPSSAFPKES